MANIMQQRRDTAANWTSKNPIMAHGQIGYETDIQPWKEKVGDGVTHWNNLPYSDGDSGGITSPIGSTLGDVMFHDTASWNRLPAGVTDQILITKGATASPVWVDNIFSNLKDVPASYTGQSGKTVKVKTDETGLEFTTSTSGSTSFIGLSDVPISYASYNGSFVNVNSTATGLVFSKVINQSKSGQFWVQNGARLNKINDRLFVGDAADNDGSYPNTAKDWLTSWQTTTGGMTMGTMAAAQFAALPNDQPSSAVGILGGSQSLHFTSASTNSLATTSFALNNNTTLGTMAWAYYGEAHKLNNVCAETFGAELNTINHTATSVLFTPYQQNTNQLVGLRLSASGTSASTCALDIRSNPVKYNHGIVIGADAITGCDGVNGSAYVLSMAKGHTIGWYEATGNQTSHIGCDVTTPATASSLSFKNNGTAFLNPSGSILFYVTGSSSSLTNYLQTSGGTSGSSPTLTASGSDTNVDLSLVTQGTGTLKFGTYTTGTVTQAGYITVKDSAGTTRRLLVG